MSEIMKNLLALFEFHAAINLNADYPSLLESRGRKIQSGLPIRENDTTIYISARTSTLNLTSVTISL